ncbi:hypothetical protein OG862_26250 [Streptomyces sp. NBC_00401]|nr:hypothetical protein [Streptomyces sp. NBC_00401]MCX5084441.1 hypothetical protein [Streptomyces sp. NBC_00401]
MGERVGRPHVVHVGVREDGGRFAIGEPREERRKVAYSQSAVDEEIAVAAPDQPGVGVEQFMDVGFVDQGECAVDRGDPGPVPDHGECRMGCHHVSLVQIP